MLKKLFITLLLLTFAVGQSWSAQGVPCDMQTMDKMHADMDMEHPMSAMDDMNTMQMDCCDDSCPCPQIFSSSVALLESDSDSDGCRYSQKIRATAFAIIEAPQGLLSPPPIFS